MYLEFEKHGEVLIAALIGELDHSSAEEVRIKIDDRIDRDDISKVILNFSKVTFMDSSGIGAVVGRYKKVKNKGGEIFIDKTYKANGRGAYICHNEECVKKLIKNKILNKVFEKSINEEVYNSIMEVLLAEK